MIDYGTAPQPRFVIIRSKRPGRYLILVDDAFPDNEWLEEIKSRIRDRRQKFCAFQDYTPDEVRVFIGTLEACRALENSTTSAKEQ